MAVIVNQTPCMLSPAYSEIFFEVHNYTDIDQTGVLECQVFINGNAQKSFFVNPDSFDTFNGQVVNQYFVDVSSTVQNYLKNNLVFPELNGYVNDVSDDFQAEIFVRFYDWLPDNNGILIKNFIFNESQKIHSINSVRYQDEETCLDVYAEGLNRPYLTDKPDKTTVCPDDNEFLYFFDSYGGSAFLGFIQTYDYNDQLKQTGVVIINTVPSNSIHRFGVGPTNINSVPAGQWLTGSPFEVITIDDETKYYDVEIHYFSLVGSGAFLKNRRYYLDRGHCKAYRIHFLNKHGFVDSFTVQKSKKELFKTNSKEYEKALPVFVESEYKNTHQQSKIYARGTYRVTAFTQDLKDSEKVWLQQLMISPLVYLEVDGNYLPVTVKDREETIVSNIDRTNDLTFDLIYSFERHSQRN